MASWLLLPQAPSCGWLMYASYAMFHRVFKVSDTLQALLYFSLNVLVSLPVFFYNLIFEPPGDVVLRHHYILFQSSFSLVF